MRGIGWQSKWLAVLLVLGTGAPCQAAPEPPPRYPKRMVRGVAVDLTPLFQWWSHKGPDRPLTSWAHVSGIVIATNSLGWVIKGEALGGDKNEEKNKEERVETFILKNPPLAERGEFERLLVEQKTAEQERARILGEDAQTKIQEDTLARQKHVDRRYRIQETTRLRATRNNAKGSVKELDAQLLELKKKLATYPNAEHFILGDFALRTGEKFGAYPVYDRGIPLVVGSPPRIDQK